MTQIGRNNYDNAKGKMVKRGGLKSILFFLLLAGGLGYSFLQLKEKSDTLILAEGILTDREISIKSKENAVFERESAAALKELETAGTVETNTRLTKELTDREKKVAEREREVYKKEQAAVAKDTHLQSLEEQLSSLGAALKEWEQKLAGLEAAVAERERLASTKESEAADQMAAVATREVAVAEKERAAEAAAADALKTRELQKEEYSKWAAEHCYNDSEGRLVCN